jgi:hypothetical protein
MTETLYEYLFDALWPNFTGTIFQQLAMFSLRSEGLGRGSF